MADTLIEQFVNSFTGAGGTPGPNTEELRDDVAALADSYDRYTARQFVKMVSKIKKTQATLPGVGDFTLTAAGAESLFTLLETSDALSIKDTDFIVNNDGVKVLNPDSKGNTTVVGGDFVGKSQTTKIDGQDITATVKQVYNILGDKIVLNDTTISNYGAVVLKSTNGTISCSGLICDASNGGLRAGSDAEKKNGKTVGNACFMISANNATNSPKSVVVRDCVFNKNASANAAQNMYNVLEFRLGSNCHSVLVENCKFLGITKNNAINIYNQPDNCTITIRDCFFEHPSNVLRLSNAYNSSNLTINFINCRFKYWEQYDAATPTLDSAWAGLCICQDYTSNNNNNADGLNNANTAFVRNIFGDNKIKINIVNCIGPQGPIQIAEGKTIADYCNNGLGNQLCYVIYDPGTTTVAERGNSSDNPTTGTEADKFAWNYGYVLMKYNEEYYPTISVSYDSNGCTTPDPTV